MSQVKASVPHGKILGPLIFLVYLNDLPKDLNSNVKLFADEASLFTLVRDPTLTTETLNKNLSKIFQLVHQSKMLFNPDSLKQIKEIVLSRKTNQSRSIFLSKMILSRRNVLKRLGLLLVVRFHFVENINAKIKKVNKGISVIKKLHLSLPRAFLLTIYKSFVQPHLDYGDVIYDQLRNPTLSDKICSSQCSKSF